MMDEREWGITSEWTKIDRLSSGGTELSEDDMCWFLYDYMADNRDINSWDRSEATRWILNFKRSIHAVKNDSYQADYKAKATKFFSRDLASFFKGVSFSIDGNAIASNEIALIPMPPSQSPDDPNYDDRMVKAAHGCSGMTMTLVVPILEMAATVTPTHRGGSRNIDVIKKNIKLVGGLPENVKIAIVIDDVITKGAHFRAARAVLQKAFSGLHICGLFWGMSRYPDL